VLVSEIKIDVAVVLGDADVHGALRSVKLRPRLEQIDLRGNRLPVQGASRSLVVAATQPAAKALAADRPRFPMTIDQDICKGSACGSVKELATCRKLRKHVGYRQACA
jgi:hypothetical protein